MFLTIESKVIARLTYNETFSDLQWYSETDTALPIGTLFSVE